MQPGYFAEGPRNPGLILPASAVSESGICSTKMVGNYLNLLHFFRAQKFVTLDSGYDSYRSLISRFGPLYTAQATDPDRAREGNFIGQGQQYLDGRTFFNVLGKKKVHAARADVAGLRAGFADCGARCPTDSKRQSHGKALGSTAF